MVDRTPALEAAHLIDRLERLNRMGTGVHGLNPAQWEALRYLARANRFSRTPAALADYLGSTRGTVSQTLIALEDKGLVAREQSARDKRSVELSLTERGSGVLGEDPILLLARDLAEGAGGDVGRLVHMLRGALAETIRRNGGKAFGACYTCRNFRRDVRPGGRSPHHCALLDEALSQRDSQAICVEQVEQVG